MTEKTTDSEIKEIYLWFLKLTKRIVQLVILLIIIALIGISIKMAPFIYRTAVLNITGVDITKENDISPTEALRRINEHERKIIKACIIEQATMKHENKLPKGFVIDDVSINGTKFSCNTVWDNPPYYKGTLNPFACYTKSAPRPEQDKCSTLYNEIIKELKKLGIPKEAASHKKSS